MGQLSRSSFSGCLAVWLAANPERVLGPPMCRLPNTMQKGCAGREMTTTTCSYSCLTMCPRGCCGAAHFTILFHRAPNQT